MTAKRGGRFVAERRKANELSDLVDEASKESFPASDPPPWTGGREALPGNPKSRSPRAKTKTAASSDAAAQVQSSKRD